MFEITIGTRCVSAGSSSTSRYAHQKDFALHALEEEHLDSQVEQPSSSQNGVGKAKGDALDPKVDQFRGRVNWHSKPDVTASKDKNASKGLYPIDAVWRLWLKFRRN